MTQPNPPQLPVELAVSTRPIIYSKSSGGAELRQGEIISNIISYNYDSSSEGVVEIRHAYAIVISQDCDLLWDYQNRADGKLGELSCVLLAHAEVISPEWRKEAGGRDIWKRIIQNKDERYHALESVSSDTDLNGDGIPDLVVDFKGVFTIPTTEIYIQINEGEGRRRSVLEMPYREHFQSRLAFYLQRVSLPDQHKITSASTSA
ncbi:hypothetical protein [Chelatococcus reniformis]|uniref:Uncharacterized protein n=1 Tax=Chelatococcus reniformis TaxID=1494448 RepID=A0A916UF98_9HYPH|nr:hypothetical protein [Chelatococcus reniformis]GGC68776.1 hypothetical protein GCM10010994_29200 [Chelatococcus reniformis]